MRKHTLLALLAFGSITLSSCYLDLGFIQIGTKDDENHKDGKLIYDEEKDKAHIAEYYTTIDSSQSGDTLLASLRTLNLAKRTNTVGYAKMLTHYQYTDYDPAYVKFTSEGIPYSGHLLSFYSGKSVLTYDREHVWPASRLPGGREDNGVDSDIFMPRPTSSEENQARGNSVYMTGMNSSTNGWDPVTAFKRNIGVYDGIRGECARIIFYVLTIDETCEIKNDSSYTKGCTHMGMIDDLMEWSCENPVNMREKRRQVGGEYLQGNRNAFVDHPEYACKIWGSKTGRTKAACEKAGYATY